MRARLGGHARGELVRRPARQRLGHGARRCRPACVDGEVAAERQLLQADQLGARVGRAGGFLLPGPRRARRRRRASAPALRRYGTAGAATLACAPARPAARTRRSGGSSRSSTKDCTTAQSSCGLMRSPLGSGVIGWPARGSEGGSAVAAAAGRAAAWRRHRSSVRAARRHRSDEPRVRQRVAPHAAKPQCRAEKRSVACRCLDLREAGMTAAHSSISDVRAGKFRSKMGGAGLVGTRERTDEREHNDNEHGFFDDYA